MVTFEKIATMKQRKKTIMDVGNKTSKHGVTSTNQQGHHGSRETNRSEHKEITDPQKTRGLRQKSGTPACTLRLPHPTSNLITERAKNNLLSQDWVCDKPCLVTIKTGVCMTNARPDIATGWPERKGANVVGLNGIRGVSSYTEESLSGTDSWMEP
jgi:hypothetical protein